MLVSIDYKDKPEHTNGQRFIARLDFWLSVTFDNIEICSMMHEVEHSVYILAIRNKWWEYDLRC